MRCDVMWFQLIAFKEQVLMRVVPTLSEVWKEGMIQEVREKEPTAGIGNDKPSSSAGALLFLLSFLESNEKSARSRRKSCTVPTAQPLPTAAACR